jgi:hypothetical protein
LVVAQVFKVQVQAKMGVLAVAQELRLVVLERLGKVITGERESAVQLVLVVAELELLAQMPQALLVAQVALA